MAQTPQLNPNTIIPNDPMNLKFGDVLLGIIATALLACAVITSTGCALFSKTATQDQKIADVHNLAYAAASIGTQEALLQNPAWRIQFEAAYVSLDQLVTQKAITGALLRNLIASLPVKELKSDRARIAIETATLLFDQTVGTKVNIEAQPYLLAAATGIRDGLRVALGRPLAVPPPLPVRVIRPN